MERLKRQQKFKSQVKPNFIQRGRFYWSLKEKPRGSRSVNLSSYPEKENGEENEESHAI